MEYTIRPVTISDYDQLFDLWNSTEQSRRALNPVDDSCEGIDRYLRRNPNTCFAAVTEGRLIGVILSVNAVPPRFELGSFWRLVRDPDYAGFLKEVGVNCVQRTFFGMEETTDRYVGRKGVFRFFVYPGTCDGENRKLYPSRIIKDIVRGIYHGGNAADT